MKVIESAGMSRALVLLLTLLTQAVFADNTGTVHGTVTDPLGAVIRGANVELLRDGKQINSTSTDQDGRFQFTSLAPGHYLVHAAASTFAHPSRPC